MSSNIPHLCKRCHVLAALLALGVQFALASNGPLVSGSYEVMQNTALGSQAQIRMRIHLVDHGPSDLSIQTMTLWDFSHPEKGGSHACAVTLRAHASTEITQEFTIPRSEYQLWRRGLRPRFVLRISGPGSTAGRTTMKSTAVVRLDRVSSRAPGEEAK